eukprot:1148577-Pelagomonas_calceolata.AAC.2
MQQLPWVLKRVPGHGERRWVLQRRCWPETAPPPGLAAGAAAQTAAAGVQQLKQQLQVWRTRGARLCWVAFECSTYAQQEGNACNPLKCSGMQTQSWSSTQARLSCNGEHHNFQLPCPFL